MKNGLEEGIAGNFLICLDFWSYMFDVVCSFETFWTLTSLHFIWEQLVERVSPFLPLSCQSKLEDSFFTCTSFAVTHFSIQDDK